MTTSKRMIVLIVAWMLALSLCATAFATEDVLPAESFTAEMQSEGGSEPTVISMSVEKVEEQPTADEASESIPDTGVEQSEAPEAAPEEKPEANQDGYSYENGETSTTVGQDAKDNTVIEVGEGEGDAKQIITVRLDGQFLGNDGGSPLTGDALQAAQEAARVYLDEATQKENALVGDEFKTNFALLGDAQAEVLSKLGMNAEKFQALGSSDPAAIESLITEAYGTDGFNEIMTKLGITSNSTADQKTDALKTLAVVLSDI